MSDQRIFEKALQLSSEVGLPFSLIQVSGHSNSLVGKCGHVRLKTRAEIINQVLRMLTEVLTTKCVTGYIVEDFGFLQIFEPNAYLPCQ